MVAKIDAISETQTSRRARQNCLWWALFFLWVASLMTAADKGWALDNTSLKGTYVIHDLQSAFGGVDPNGGWGVSDSAAFSSTEVTFDGNGTWSGTSTSNELERQMTQITKDIGGDEVLSNKFNVLAPTPSSEANSGTYTVSGDGTGTVTHSEGTEPFFVSADGSVILMGNRNYNSANHYAWVSMSVGVKKGSGLSTASLKGTYVIHDLQSAFGGVDPNGGWGISDSTAFSRTEVTFNGAGAWRGTATDNELERLINEVTRDQAGDKVLSDKFSVLVPLSSSQAISGTYAVGNDGTGTITHAEGTEPLFVSADGSIILLGKRDYNSANHYAWVSMGVGVKKTSIPRGMPWMPLLLDE
jgi:hypothetical protein